MKQKQQKRRNDQKKRKDKAPEDLLPPREQALVHLFPSNQARKPAGGPLQPGQVDPNQQQNPNDSDNDSGLRSDSDNASISGDSSGYSSA